MGKKSGPSTAPAQQATAQSIALQKKMYEEGKQYAQPFYDIGLDSIRELSGRLLNNGDLSRGFTMDDFQADPGYQFRLAEGQKGIERSAAARGSALAPSTLKALQGFNQNLASEEYLNAYNRFNNDQTNLFNRLATLGGYGQTATGQITGAGQNYANNLTNLYTGLANTQMSAQQAGQANRGSMFNNLASLGMGIGLAPVTGGGSLFGSWLSDENLKEDIQKVGEVEGIPVYEFRYTGRPERYRGVIAQDIQEIMPEAVTEIDGYLAVNYDLLPINMEVIE